MIICETNIYTIDTRSIVGITVTIPFDLYSSYDAAVICKYLSFKLKQLYLFYREKKPRNISSVFVTNTKYKTGYKIAAR